MRCGRWYPWAFSAHECRCPAHAEVGRWLEESGLHPKCTLRTVNHQVAVHASWRERRAAHQKAGKTCGVCHFSFDSVGLTDVKRSKRHGGAFVDSCGYFCNFWWGFAVYRRNEKVCALLIVTGILTVFGVNLRIPKECDRLPTKRKPMLQLRWRTAATDALRVAGPRRSRLTLHSLSASHRSQIASCSHQTILSLSL